MIRSQGLPLGTYSLLLSANTVVSIAFALLGPLWVLFLQDFSSSKIVIALAISFKFIIQGCSSPLAGMLSDKFGRKPLITMGRLVTMLIFFSYPWITSLSQLIVLQILFGVVAAFDSTPSQAFLGDITQKASRGLYIGISDGMGLIISGGAVLLGTLIAERFGMDMTFYVIGTLFLLSLLPILLTKEE